MKICFRAAIRLFLLLLVSFLLYYPVLSLLRSVYSELNLRFETVFPIYNPITDAENYLKFENNFVACAAAVIFFLLSLVSSAFDNERYEYIIGKTDGFYKIADGVRIYSARYAAADAVSAVISPLPLFLFSLFKFPKTEVRFLLLLEEWVDGFLISAHAFTDRFGFILGFAAATSILLCAKIPAAIIGLKRWRGLWLSDVEN